MFIVTVTEVFTIEEKTKEWQRLTDEPADGKDQYGYVEAVLPKKKDSQIYRQEFASIDLPKLVLTLNEVKK